MMNIKTSLFNVDTKGKLLQDAKLIFEKTLNSYASDDVYINDSLDITKAIIREKYDSNGEQMKIQTRLNDIYRGDLIKYRDKYWIVTSYPESDEVYSKAMISYCSTTFPYFEKGVRELVVDANGKPVLNTFGREQYKDSPSKIVEIPCFVESSFFSKDTNTQLPLIDGSLFITIPYNPNRKISYNYEFSIFGDKYKVASIDYSKVSKDRGIVRLICRVVV